MLGVGALTGLVGLRVLAPRAPGPLIVLAGSMVLVRVLALPDEGVAVVGEPTGPLLGLGIPTGLSADRSSSSFLVRLRS